MTPFILFVYLQLLDLLTTLAGLAHGGHEMNPVVVWSLKWFPTPLIGFIAMKLIACGVAFYVRTGPKKYLGVPNVFYSLLIVWNLLGLILI